MIIEDKNILITKEKEYIKNIILGEKTPFYWAKETVIGKGEPCLVHGLIHRKTQKILLQKSSFGPIQRRRIRKKVKNHRKKATINEKRPK